MVGWPMLAAGKQPVRRQHARKTSCRLLVQCMPPALESRLQATEGVKMTREGAEVPAGDGADLPHPDSQELRALLSGREAQEAYRFLYETRADPQPMSAWVERSQRVFGKTNSNTGRRLRDVRSAFVVNTFKQAGS